MKKIFILTAGIALALWTCKPDTNGELGSPANKLEKLVFVGTAASRFQVAPVPTELHDKTLVLHGEVDDTVPLASVLDWARPQSLPVTVIPGVEHFFHGQLPLLRNLISRHLQT